MKHRILRISTCFATWLIPIAGIYFSSLIRSGWGLSLTILSALAFLPTSGWLFDAITNDRVLYFNINRPWECHLGKDDEMK